MTNRDRDSVAKLLSQVADRLAAAPDTTLESAQRNHPEAPCPYQVGALEEVCRREAEAIRSFVAGYLTPRVQVRGKR